MKTKIFNWLTFVCIGLLVLDKTFAYLGVTGAYITEITVLVSLTLFLPNVLYQKKGFGEYLILLIWVYTLLGVTLIDSFRYIPTEILRDVLIVLYPAIYIIIQRNKYIDQQTIVVSLSNILKYLTIFNFLYPILFVVFRVFQSYLPEINGVKLFHLKPGDVAVTLSIYIILRSCLNRAKNNSLENIFLTINIILLLSISRASILVVGIALFYVFGNKITQKKLAFSVLSIILLITASYFLNNVEINLGLNRTISINQITDNIISIFIDNNKEGLSGSRAWRIEWWTQIINNKLSISRLFYGDGFGISLAELDGFQVLEDNSLRSPHNFVLNILSRGGIVYTTLWLILFMYLLTKKPKSEISKSIYVILVVFIINSLFDVYFEGPMGAYPFWYFAGLYNKMILTKVKEINSYSMQFALEK
ncbi:hypothetical protein GCM10027347_32190 [Larkinella harenae]